ncbi:MAG: ATP-binding protein [Actinomycetota bacterium]
MLSPILVIAALAVYMVLLFALAAWAERKSPAANALTDSPLVYVLSLGVFCTSWTFYGSVGVAVRSGLLYLAVYLGPTLAWLLGWTLTRRLARFTAEHRVSNLGDLLAARYGRTPGLPALATLLALLAINPYIALQLKSILSTFNLMVGKGLGQHWAVAGGAVDFLVVGFVAVITLIFGLRQLDPTQRQRGIVLMLAVQSVVKLAAFLAVGIFVTYGLYDGLGDIFRQVATHPEATGMWHTGSSQWYSTFLTWLILSICASLFLPQQFHITIVELPRISLLRPAMWGLPLYLLAITFFVYPIAAAGLLNDYPVSAADTYVLALPIDHASPWLAVVVFIGGFSSAVGMIVICSMTLSVMVANNLVMPLTEGRSIFKGIRRHGLAVRRVAVVCIVVAGYFFQRAVGESYFLVGLGLIAFAGALQFAPAILGGMFWHGASRTGAQWGLSAGFAVWAYTLFLPAMAKSGWLPPTVLLEGPFGLSFLRPEALFGLSSVDPLTQGVFWSLLVNIGGLILGSCWRPVEDGERQAALEFHDGNSIVPSGVGGQGDPAAVDLDEKLGRLRGILTQFLSAPQTVVLIDDALAKQHLLGRRRISHLELMRFLESVETALSGAVGAAAAHAAMRQSALVSSRESKEIARIYSRILTDLNLSPEELRRRVDYYQERNEIINRHAAELAEKVDALEQEVAARTQAEGALRESEKRFRSMADSAPVLIWMSERDGGRSYFNQAWLAFTGRSLAQELRHGWLESMAAEDRNAWENAVASAVSGSRPYSLEYRLRRHDGCYRWIAEHGSPRLSAEGNVVGFIGSCLDISDMKAAADALRRSRDELENLVAERTAALTASNTALHSEVEQRRQAEESLLSSYAELKHMNERLAEAQSQLLQSEKMASIGQLAAGVAHEINNPIGFVNSNLVTLRGYVDDLLSLVDAYRKLEDDPGNPEAVTVARSQRESVDLEYLREDIPSLMRETLEGIQRVRQIVKDLKDFSHVDKAEWQEADLHAGLDSTLNVVWNELKYKAQVVKEYGDLPLVSCIPSQLNQVFMNLLVNAAHAIPERGTITIRTGGEGEWVWVEIADTGKGISPEVLNRIFEPFFTTKPVGVGTGLGLSVSYGIIKKHGGRIDVQSEVGQGTAFRVWLPVSHQEAPEATV